MITVASIAAAAMNAVASQIRDGVHAATLATKTQGAYSTANGAFAYSSTSTAGRVVVDTVTPPGDLFPDYVAGPGDELLLLEGFTACKEGDVVTYQGKDKTVAKVQDIAGAGTLFYALTR